MTNNGKNIVDGFKVFGNFCKDVALLLKTANNLMEDHDWLYISHKTKAVQQLSSLKESDYWLPDAYFCFYENVKCKQLLSYIAIHVGDYSDPGRDIKEPRISAGWLDYGRGKNAIGAWEKDYRVCYAHLWINNNQAKCNGKLYHGDLREIYEDKSTPSGIKVATFARNLEEITNSEKLREKIVQPLLDGLNTRKKEVP